MKKILLLFVVLFTTLSFANGVDTTQLVVESTIPTLKPIIEVATPFVFDKITFFDIVVPALLAILSALFTDTLKHLKDGTWKASVFLKTKLLPCAVSILVVLGVWVFSVVLGDKFNFILEAFKDNIEVFGFTSTFIITTVIDQLLKTKKVEEDIQPSDVGFIGNVNFENTPTSNNDEWNQAYENSGSFESDDKE